MDAFSGWIHVWGTRPVILELLEYCCTPCPRIARKLGFLTSTIQVRARHARCRRAWEPHLQHTRSLILEAAALCPQKRKVALLGAGLLHDIPLPELAGMFEEVLLVDLVHPWSSRLAARRFPNVRRVSADLTEIMTRLEQSRSNPAMPLPRSHPTLLREEPGLDLTVSVNVLSQLPWVPGLLLEGRRPEEEVAAFQRHLLEAHLQYLAALPGRTVLVADTRWSSRPAGSHGAAPETWDVLQGAQLPPQERGWEWQIAPAPERDPNLDFTAHVSAWLDWKRAHSQRTPPAP